MNILLVWSHIEGEGDARNGDYWKSWNEIDYLFSLPKGSIGKLIVEEMTTTTQIERWTNNTSERGFYLKSLMIMPNLLLQKSSISKNA